MLSGKSIYIYVKVLSMDSTRLIRLQCISGRCRRDCGYCSPASIVARAVRCKQQRRADVKNAACGTFLSNGWMISTNECLSHILL